MRYLVRCLNCGIKWVRVIAISGGGSDTEYINDLMYNCPNCCSNWYEDEELNETINIKTEDTDKPIT